MRQIMNIPARWRTSLRVYLLPETRPMLFLGFASGLPYLLVFSTLFAWLTEAGISRTAIGFLSWISIAYTLKFLWATLVDHVSIPWLSKALGRRRAWILSAQFVIIAALFTISTVNPNTDFVLFISLIGVVAFASATQDIAIDAYRIEATIEEYQAAMAAMYIFGYRLALLLAGAGSFFIAEYWGWNNAYFFMAISMLLGVATILLVKEKNIAPRPRKFPSLLEPIKEFFVRNHKLAWIILVLVGIYRMSDITMGVMANPFYLDTGYTKIQIAEVSKLLGFFMTLFGVALGGVFVSVVGVMRMLGISIALVIITNLAFVLLSLYPPDIRLLALIVSCDNLSGGIATTVFIAYLSSLTSREHTATQYALFSSLMLLPAKLLGGISGIIVDSLGYTFFFIYAGLLGVPVIFLIAYLARRISSVDPTKHPV